MSISALDDDDDKWEARINKCTQGELDDILCTEAAKGNVFRIERLIAHGADPKADESACLYHAITSRSPEAVRCLLNAGADANAQNFLCISIAHGYSALAEVFLEYGADPARYYRDLDAEGWASELGDTEVLQMLRNPKPRALPTQRPPENTAEKGISALKRRDLRKYRL